VDKHLSEDLLADLEVAVFVKVLEEALGVKSVLADHSLERFHALLDNLAVVDGWLGFRVDRCRAHIVKADGVVLLETLLGEDLIDPVDKVLPADMLTFLGCLEFFRKQFKFLRRNLNLGHVEPDSELALGDEAGPQLVKVSEELPNTDALLLAQHT
jgi:hypothetical protein